MMVLISRAAVGNALTPHAAQQIHQARSSRLYTHHAALAYARAQNAKGTFEVKDIKSFISPSASQKPTEAMFAATLPCLRTQAG